MKKFIFGLGIGALGYACWFTGRVYQLIQVGTVYRQAELGDAEALKAMEQLSDITNDFNENFTKLKRKFRR